MTITYVTGDACRPPRPEGDSVNVILHVCNTQGAWGAGFVTALSARYSAPEAEYRSLRFPIVQPKCQIVYVDEDTDVVNMIAQKMRGNHYIRYSWLNDCLAFVAKRYKDKDVTFHLPRIGTGIGGGVWEDVRWLIESHLGDRDVFVYDLPSQRS